MQTDTAAPPQSAEDRFLELVKRHENEASFTDGDWIYKQGVLLSEPFGWSWRSYDHTLELTGDGLSPTFGGKGYLGMDVSYLKNGTGYSWAYAGYLFGLYIGLYDGSKFGRILVWGAGVGVTGGGTLSINYNPSKAADGAGAEQDRG